MAVVKPSVSEIITFSALLTKMMETDPDFQEIHVQMALDTAHSLIVSFGDYDTNHSLYETNIRLAHVFLTDKYFLTAMSASSARLFHQNLLLERVGDHVVQFAYPKIANSESGIFSEADSLVERLLTAILSADARRSSRMFTTHVFTYNRLPTC